MILRYEQIIKSTNIEIEELRTKDANFEEKLNAEKDKLAEVENEKYKIQKGLEYVEFQLTQKDKKIEGLTEIVKGKMSTEQLQEVLPVA